METEQDFGLLERSERRRRRESLVRVWDRVVRVGHWLMAICFAIIYLRYRKFPLHVYAGYLMLSLVTLRLVWGLIGSRAARFTSFWFTPAELWHYALNALRGKAAYFLSHNPMGSWMVFSLLGLILINGILGLLLYSAGQQMGPFGAAVPENWEDWLKLAHTVLGHFTAALVAIHIAGVIWAVRVHRENYVLAMFTGNKRLPRHVDEAAMQGYQRLSEDDIPASLRPVENWLSHRHPFVGSILLALATTLVVLEITEAVTKLNKYLPGI